MRLQIIVSTAVILAVLPNTLTGFNAMAGDVALMPQIAASSDDAQAAKNATARHRHQASGRCGWLGVKVRPMTAAFADSLGMTRPYGAIFERPLPGSPAAAAKIEAYDLVTAINGSPLASWRDFAPTIAKMAPGTRVYLTTWRSRQLIDVRAILGFGQCRQSWPRSGAQRA